MQFLSVCNDACAFVYNKTGMFNYSNSA